MLNVKTPDEVLELISSEFHILRKEPEYTDLASAVGRILASDIVASEYVPDFDRSTVDGYAVHASDTFGCSDSIPIMMEICREIRMGESADFILSPGQCCYIPTGGALPKGADACVMIEYAEDYGDGTVGIMKPAAPGQNVIFRGDDVSPGRIMLNSGRILCSQDIGALAAIGVTSVPVVPKLKVGIISTGDELVPPDKAPAPGQIRNTNSPMLSAMISAAGYIPIDRGIIADDEEALLATVTEMISKCDAVLISGGSSVGVKDATCRIIESVGTLLLHGIAMKPGKPTIIGRCGEKPIIGLPGHPVAAFFVTKLFVLPILQRMSGGSNTDKCVKAVLSESVGANDGRAQYMAVDLKSENGRLIAHPIRSKSGLITNLAGSDGFFCIPRDSEGLAEGSEITVTLCKGE